MLARWHDEELGESAFDFFIGARPNLFGALHVDIHHDVYSFGKVIENF